MNFNVIYKDKILTGQPTYSIEENSFSYDPWENTNFSIMIGKAYNSLDVRLDTCEASHLSGCNPQKNWIEKKLEIPKAHCGMLKVTFEDTQISGTGVYYTDNWLTYYDKKTEWLCIGDSDISLNILAVEFAKDTIAIVQNSKLVAIWVKPKFK